MPSKGDSRFHAVVMPTDGGDYYVLEIPAKNIRVAREKAIKLRRHPDDVIGSIRQKKWETK